MSDDINFRIKYYEGVIYLLVFPNEKKYVGQTINFSDRMRSYRNNNFDVPVHNAIRHFGWKNVKLYKLEIINGPCKDTIIEIMNVYEPYYIQEHNTHIDNGEGYNCDLGGRNKTPSLVTRNKMSESTKGKKHPNWGKKLSKELCNKIAESHKGKKRTEEHKKNISESLKGDKHPRRTPKLILRDKDIIRRLDNGERNCDIARDMNITPAVVGHTKTRYWKLKSR